MNETRRSILCSDTMTQYNLCSECWVSVVLKTAIRRFKGSFNTAQRQLEEILCDRQTDRQTNELSMSELAIHCLTHPEQGSWLYPHHGTGHTVQPLPELVLQQLPAGEAQVMPVPSQLRGQWEVICAAVKSEMENRVRLWLLIWVLWSGSWRLFQGGGVT